MRDKSKMATFKGDVHVVQGETDVRCNELVVYYDDEKTAAAPKAKAAEGSSSGQQQIRRMEARGSVVVTQKDQRAVGDRAEFDMRSNTVTLIGNVVVTNAENVVRGSRMVVDLTTGVARMGETGGGGRVEGIFNSKPRRPSRESNKKQLIRAFVMHAGAGPPAATAVASRGIGRRPASTDPLRSEADVFDFLFGRNSRRQRKPASGFWRIDLRSMGGPITAWPGRR